MRKSQRVANDIIGGLKDFVGSLKENGDVSEKFTVRRITLDLGSRPYSPKSAKAARQLLNASQVIFAQFLGVSPKTVRAWEQGTALPSLMARRWLDEIQRNPDFWRKRFSESIVVKEVCA